MPEPPLPPAAEELAQFIVDRGLATPAALFLGLNRPLAHLGSQALIVGGGFLAPLLGLERFRAVRQTLEDPACFDAFLDRLEALSREQPDRNNDAKCSHTTGKD